MAEEHGRRDFLRTAAKGAAGGLAFLVGCSKKETSRPVYSWKDDTIHEGTGYRFDYHGTEGKAGEVFDLGKVMQLWAEGYTNMFQGEGFQFEHEGIEYRIQDRNPKRCTSVAYGDSVIRIFRYPDPNFALRIRGHPGKDAIENHPIDEALRVLEIVKKKALEWDQLFDSREEYAAINLMLENELFQLTGEHAKAIRLDEKGKIAFHTSKDRVLTIGSGVTVYSWRNANWETAKPKESHVSIFVGGKSVFVDHYTDGKHDDAYPINNLERMKETIETEKQAGRYLREVLQAIKAKPGE